MDLLIHIEGSRLGGCGSESECVPRPPRVMGELPGVERSGSGSEGLDLMAGVGRGPDYRPISWWYGWRSGKRAVCDGWRDVSGMESMVGDSQR
jgi:hypothetical protein